MSTAEVSRTPWRESIHTQIWNVTEWVRGAPGTIEHPEDDAALGVWLLHAPWMALAWHWHYVAVIHLRDLPGQSRRPHLAFPEATHELMCMAIDPTTEPDVSKPWKPLKFLRPVSIVQQFAAGSDAEALGRTEEILEQVYQGKVTVEENGRYAWRERLLHPQPSRAL